eukprot:470296-Rhodomonas_salina.1
MHLTRAHRDLVEVHGVLSDGERGAAVGGGIEDGVDEAREAHAAGVDQPHARLRLLGQRRVLGQRRRQPDDAVQRRAQLVRHRREKLPPAFPEWGSARTKTALRCETRSDNGHACSYCTASRYYYDYYRLPPTPLWPTGTGARAQEHSANSNTRNRIPGAICTENAVARL